MGLGPFLIVPAGVRFFPWAIGTTQGNDTRARSVLAPAPWIQSAKLTAAGGVANDRFGRSVAVSGDTIVVGTSTPGRAYVFVRPSAGWSGTRTQTATLTASGGAPGDGFGSSVAINGDTIVVGAPDSTVGLNAGQGRAYVFVRPAAGWSGARSQTAELTAFGGAAGDHFGSSVAIGSDTALVGAPDSIVGLNAGQGRAYVFVRPAAGWSGTRSQTAVLTDISGAAGIGFGSSVAIRSDMALVGAPHSTVGLNAGQGSAFVFFRPILGWSGTRGQTSELTDFAGASGDKFGFSLAISSDTVLVGADGRDADQGAAYVFTGGTGLNFFFLPLILRE